MTVHHINIDRKYFEPIRQGKVNLLIFKKRTIKDAQPGDCILASKGNYNVKAFINRCYIKSFDDITEEEAQKAGFLNKEFLRDELIYRYELKPRYNYGKGELNDINNELFFLIELNEEKETKYSLRAPNTTVTLFSKEFNKEFYNYNPEYDSQPWRDLL